MAPTYKLISSSVLASNTTTINFSSIPSSYTDLILRYSARATSTNSGGNSLTIRINNSSSAEYSMTRIRAAGSSVTSDRFDSQTGLYTYITVASDGMEADLYSTGQIYFPSYRDIYYNRVAAGLGAISTNGSATWAIDYDAFLRQSAVAITSIQLTTTNDFKIGSTFYLYGIKNS